MAKRNDQKHQKHTQALQRIYLENNLREKLKSVFKTMYNPNLQHKIKRSVINPNLQHKIKRSVINPNLQHKIKRSVINPNLQHKIKRSIIKSVVRTNWKRNKPRKRNHRLQKQKVQQPQIC